MLVRALKKDFSGIEKYLKEKEYERAMFGFVDLHGSIKSTFSTLNFMLDSMIEGLYNPSNKEKASVDDFISVMELFYEISRQIETVYDRVPDVFQETLKRYEGHTNE